MLPDLVVQRVEFVDCAPRVGVTIYNQSAAAAESALEVRLTAFTNAQGGPIETAQRIGGLGAFSTTRLIFELPPADAYAAIVDAKNAVTESNETNNELRVATRSLIRCPTVEVGNAKATEGESIRFPVTISHAFSQPVRVRLVTEDRTATGAAFGLAAGDGPTSCGADFIRGTPTLEFAAGTSVLTQTVAISTCVDGVREKPETFALRIEEIVNGTSGRGSIAIGTIDDAAADRSPVQ